MSYKIKALAKTLIIFSYFFLMSDILMTSFLIKEGTGISRHLGSSILN